MCGYTQRVIVTLKIQQEANKWFNLTNEIFKISKSLYNDNTKRGKHPNKY